MTAKHISVAEAKAKFSAMIDGVLHRGEHYLIERHSRGVAALVSVDELKQLEQAVPAADSPAGAMALVGLWHDVPDDEIDALLAHIHTARDRDIGRSVELEA